MMAMVGYKKLQCHGTSFYGRIFMTTSEKPGGKVSRRDFFKIGAVAGAGLQVAGIAGAGYVAGKTTESYTAWRDFSGAKQTDRKAWEIDKPPHRKVGATRRPNKDTEYIFKRNMLFGKALKDGWKPDQGVEKLGEPLASFYKRHPDDLKNDIERYFKIFPKRARDTKKYKNYFALANAYSAGWGDIFTSYPPEPDKPPEESDYEMVKYGGTGRPNVVKKIGEPMPFKSKDHASKLIKKIAHLYGATVVGIAKLNPDWVWDRDVRGGKPGPFQVPKHWEYAIVVGVPHEWDQVLSNPAHGTSYDGYNRARNCSGRLTAFIKGLGYPARSHHPPAMYDLILPPVTVDAGVGELGRHGFVITPETGANIRTACVTTNLPMTVDKPIEFGVKHFCRTCKICAELCPSGSISMADSEKGMVLRGYEHWFIDTSSCINYWFKAMGPLGCRLCLACCPYSRKGNYAHKLSQIVDRNDPTGLAASALTWMQKLMFKAPGAQEYLPPPDGRFASYREAPAWLKTEEWFDVPIRKPKKGDA